MQRLGELTFENRYSKLHSTLLSKLVGWNQNATDLLGLDSQCDPHPPGYFSRSRILPVSELLQKLLSVLRPSRYAIYPPEWGRKIIVNCSL